MCRRAPLTGGGAAVEPPDGPGALLRHFAGGIGGTGFPGSPTWTRDTGFARYWSHLVGGVQVFEEMAGLAGVGLWARTTSPNALTVDTVATYDTATLRLTAVGFPDGSTEEFDYGYQDSSPSGDNSSGKLWKIREKGVDGSVKATWVYYWTRGAENNLDGEGLMQVDRPDGTKLHFFYNDSRHPGYLPGWSSTARALLRIAFSALGPTTT